MTFGYEFHLAQLFPFPKQVQEHQNRPTHSQVIAPQTRPISECLYGKSTLSFYGARAIAKCHYLGATLYSKHNKRYRLTQWQTMPRNLFVNIGIWVYDDRDLDDRLVVPCIETAIWIPDSDDNWARLYA